MSAFKGTPGPWRVGRQNNIQTAHESPLNWKGIAQYMGSGQEAEANARLIAAAPDLLEVAQRSADALRSAGIEPRATSDNPLEWLLHQTEAAIAKATGGAA